jgi:urate oxidase
MAENNWNHHENKHFVDTKKKLDKVGCGFCLAKWTQVTIQMQTGHTHSCHHPKTHKIPVSELKRNPSALHNTRFKKRRRREMLEGKIIQISFQIEFLNLTKVGLYLILMK